MEFNSIDPIGHEEEPRRLFRSHRLRRGIYILPSMFTVANLLCGYYAILAIFEGKPEYFDKAACAIGFAILFDSLDGRVARLMGTDSEFGKQFDSLADVVSFGMAPAFLAYAWGIRALAAANTSGLGSPHAVGLADRLLLPRLLRLAARAIQYSGDGAWRQPVLRRNADAGGGRDDSGNGTCFQESHTGWARGAHVVGAWLLVLGLLMSSSVRYYSFKEVKWTRRMPSLAIILLVIVIASIVLFSQGHTL